MSSSEWWEDVEPTNYKAEKEFLTDVDGYLETIRDISKETEWKKRIDAMENLQKVIAGNARHKFPAAFSGYLLKSVVPLTTQVLDLRSAIVKKAAQTIEFMAIVFKNAFEHAAERYISSNSLLKVILSGNKLLAENGHEAILTILQHVYSPKYLLALYNNEEMKGKNPILRAKCCQYLLCMLYNYPLSILEKYTANIGEMIAVFLNEAAAETRAIARECYAQYATILPENAKVLMGRLPPAAQKAIIESANRKAISGELPKVKPSPIRLPHKSPYVYNKEKARTNPENTFKRSSTSPKSKKLASESPIITKSKILLKQHPVVLQEENWVGGPQPEELSQSGFEDSKEDPIRFLGLGSLFKQCGSSDLKKKVAALDELGKRVQNEELDPKNGEIKEAITIIIKNIADTNTKIAYSALQCMSNMIIVYNRHIQEFLSELAPKLLFSMSSDKESISNLSNYVFQLMQTNYGADKLIPHFVKSLDPPYLTRVKAGALELLNILIKFSKCYFLQESNIKSCIIKVVNLINEYYTSKNKKILLPALGVLLALRDKSYQVTINAILSLPESYIAKVRTMAHEYAPDLESNMNTSALQEADSAAGIKINILRNLAAKKQAKESLLSPDEETKYYTLGELKGLLLEETVHSPEEIKHILDMAVSLGKASAKSIEWNDLTPKVLRFVFNNAIYGAEDWLQETGFAVLTELVRSLAPYLDQHLDDLLANLVRCYIFPRKVWNTVDGLFRVIAKIFTPQRIISVLAPSVKVEKPPILQNTIRALNNVVKAATASELTSITQTLKDTLFETINHEEAEVRKAAVLCIVEVCSTMRESFTPYLADLTPSQVKLIKIYLEKRS